jgi:hypothetical protein
MEVILVSASLHESSVRAIARRLEDRCGGRSPIVCDLEPGTWEDIRALLSEFPIILLYKDLASIPNPTSFVRDNILRDAAAQM